MSAYTVVEIQMNDDECIKAALTEMGYAFESHKTAQSLYGVGGRADQKQLISLYVDSMLVPLQTMLGSYDDQMAVMK